MRTAFVKALLQSAQSNDRIVLLSGDLGFNVFEEFAAQFPRRFINMGVGEANMIGVAAGLAHEGYLPIVYSIIPFITMRCYEQIRNDLCSHNVNVKVVGVGSGLGYAHLGISHHAAEDISIMRTLANMSVLVPADPREVTASVRCAVHTKGPVYMRLGKNGEPLLHAKEITPEELIHPLLLRAGVDAVLFTAGTIAANCIQAAELLVNDGIELAVYSMPSIKPFNAVQLVNITRKIPSIFTAEEHSVIGGLGSTIAEVLMEHTISVRCFQRIGIPDTFCRTIGTYEYMKDSMGLSPQKIAAQIKFTMHKLRVSRNQVIKVLSTG
jgi:transketolase